MSNFKSLILNFLIAIVFIAIGWFAHVAWTLPKEVSPVAQIKPHPLEKYTIENLSAKYSVVEPSNIVIGKQMEKSKQAKNGKFTPYEFTYSFDPTLGNGQKKTVSGLINIPDGKGPFPLLVMIRGFVDQKQYFIGEGTQHAAEFFADKGFITIAPDFLGYGDSDQESSDIFESRFQTYTTMIVLLKSLDTLKEAPLKVGSNYIKIDTGKISIWAHSNGGQIALTSLEITGLNYRTVLWAPNSAKFPYSILYYLDEADDQGKLVITKLAEFMADYDTTKYAFNFYLDKIKAPIHIDQGTADDAVPIAWNEQLTKNLKKLNINVTLTKYPGADHNLQPAWQNAIENDLSFFTNS